MSDRLPHPPLSEAIFEVHWNDTGTPPTEGTVPILVSSGPQAPHPVVVDRHHTIFIGRVFESLTDQGFDQSPLHAASIPTEFAPHVVQYQFWSSGHKWPVYQVGPGILTLNHVDDYTWDEFHVRGAQMVGMLQKLHPAKDEVRIEKLSLRYLNTVEFDYTTEDVHGFLNDNMHTSIQFPRTMFDSGEVSSRPLATYVRTSFRTVKPIGVVTVQISTAQREEKPVIFWETTVLSSGTDVPGLDALDNWMTDAHSVATTCFHSLTSGSLERSFYDEQS